MFYQRNKKIEQLKWKSHNRKLFSILQTFELWDMVKNQTMTVHAAHEGLIAALAQSPVTGMVASASHDHSVKLWK